MFRKVQESILLFEHLNAEGYDNPSAVKGFTANRISSFERIKKEKKLMGIESVSGGDELKKMFTAHSLKC